MTPRSPERVVWSEGMLVSPQHFQQADLYHERLLDARLGALSPFAWGVISLSFDARALEAEQVGVAAFEGVFPDGTVVRFDGGAEGAPRRRAIGSHFAATRASLPVFLGLPKERARAANVEIPDTADVVVRGRFRGRRSTVIDRVAGASDVDVVHAEPNLVLLFGDESRDDFDCLPIGELVRAADGRISLHPTFVPPFLRASASAFVADGLRRVVALGSARAKALREERRQRDAGSVEYEANDVTRFLFLHSIHSHLPVLTHYAESGAVTAHALYLELVSLGGELCSFTSNDDPASFPEFRYGDLRATFEPLFARILALLQAVLGGRFVSVPLESREDGMHFGRLDDARIRVDGARFMLAVHADVPEAQALGLVPRLAKVASWDGIASLLGAAMPGARLEAELRPPKEIPTRAGATYYGMTSDDPYVRAIRNESTIAVHLPPPFEPSRVRLELLVVLSSAA